MSDSDYESPARKENAAKEEASPRAAAEEDPSPERDEDYYETTPEESPERQRKDNDAYDTDDHDHQQDADQSPAPPRSKSHSRRRNYPPVATVTYPARDKNLQVTDFLDPSRPLVKSTVPLTKPIGPSFVEEEKIINRLRRRQTHKQKKSVESSKISKQRSNERRYLKAQYEFEREKQLAERAIYHRERCNQWAQRLGASPLAVDLVADNERIEEEAYIRDLEERRRKTLAEKKKRRVKNQIIVKALAEVPLLEEARRQKREMLDEERRERALRDVQRVEVIQMRKARDQALMEKERQERLDQRIMGQTAK